MRNTSAPGKDGRSMTKTTISAERAMTKPKYGAAAAALLAKAREFYQDTENERAFLEWKAGKEAKK